MPEILLAAVNARFNHTNIAVRTIALYCGSREEPGLINFSEWTINQNLSDILRRIAEQSPKILLFSTYIWNSEIIQKLIPEIKKVLPDCVIGCGGPEAGFNPKGWLSELPALDFVISGEGEETVKEIAELYRKITKDAHSHSKSAGTLQNALLASPDFRKIPGLWLRNETSAVSSTENRKNNCAANFSNSQSVEGGFKSTPDDTTLPQPFFFTGERPLICDLSSLPFPYPVIQEPDNKIHYYESSRGCPFSCAYCMSSLDKRVRFMPLERVFSDLQRFLDAKTKLVKFVDRTYNLQEERYLKIWEYILQHHNGITMFHFEIEAEFLSQKALDFLQKVPAGIMQFEIGVQSANPKTLAAVNRSTDTQKLKANIQRIPRTIHTHLDLIAGLPFEDLKSFGSSFDFVMSMHPDALQLGFLKVLHGTQMEEYSKENGWQWMENPPYETLSTPYLSYADILFLKDLEKLTDIYWNSGRFFFSMKLIENRLGFWNFFCRMTQLARKNGALLNEHKIDFWFEFLAEHREELFEEVELWADCTTGTSTEYPTNCTTGTAEQQRPQPQNLLSDPELLFELLRYDLIKSQKINRFPEWYKRNYNAEAHTQSLKNAFPERNIKMLYAASDFEEFQTDVRMWACNIPPEPVRQPTGLLILYPEKLPE